MDVALWFSILALFCVLRVLKIFLMDHKDIPPLTAELRLVVHYTLDASVVYMFIRGMTLVLR